MLKVPRFMCEYTAFIRRDLLAHDVEMDAVQEFEIQAQRLINQFRACCLTSEEIMRKLAELHTDYKWNYRF